MNGKQLPISTLNNVDLGDFIIVSGNCMELAKSGVIHAKAGGWVGANMFESYPALPPDFEGAKKVKKFAIVKRKDQIK